MIHRTETEKAFWKCDFLPFKNLIEVDHTENIQIDKFVETVLENSTNVFNSYHHNTNDSKGWIKNAGESLLSSIETDYATGLHRQEIFTWLLGNEPFVRFLTQTTVPGTHRLIDNDRRKSKVNFDEFFDLYGYVDQVHAFTKDEPLLSSYAKSLEEIKSETIAGKLWKQFDLLDRPTKVSISLDAEIGSNCISCNSSVAKYVASVEGLTIMPAYTHLDSIEFNDGNVYEYWGFGFDETFWTSLFRAFYSANRKAIVKLGREYVPISIEVTVEEMASGEKVAAATFSFENIVNTLYLSSIKIGRNRRNNADFTWSVVPKDGIAAGIATEWSRPFGEARTGYFGWATGFDSIVDFWNQFFEHHSELVFLANLARFIGEIQNKVHVCIPVLLEREAEILNLKGCTNPVYASRSKNQKNDISFDANRKGLFITGVNNNGKTSFMNAVAFNQILAQSVGIVFARKATLSMRDEVLLHYPSQEDVNANASRYMSELNRFKEAIPLMSRYSLVCLDEGFANTNIVSATTQSNIAVDLLHDVIGCTFIVTTHLAGVIIHANTKPLCFHRHVVPGSYSLKNGYIIIENSLLLDRVPIITLEEMKGLLGLTVA